MSKTPEQVDPQTVKQWLDAGEAVVIDVRESNEVAAARIPGAIHIPMSSFNSALIPDLNGQKLVFLCAGGFRSDKVAQFLLDNGDIDEAVNMIGGIKGWASAGLPITC